MGTPLLTQAVMADEKSREPAPLARAPRIIGWAFEQFATNDASAARRAAASLDLLLAGIYESIWPEVAWSHSALTGDFPCAFAFSSADETIRYETEVAGHELNEAQRLPRALQRLALLGAGPPPEAINNLLRRVQTAGALTYGAWVSGRHDATTDRYKIYAEVPASGSPEADLRVRQLFGETLLLRSRRPLLRMIGYELGTSRLEFYYRLRGMEISDVEALLHRAGLEKQTTALLELMEDAFVCPLRIALPTAQLGFSLSIMPDGGSIVVSIFAFAQHVFGGERTIRRRLLEIGAQRGWPWRHYELLSESLAEGQRPQMKHGMVSFIASPHAQPTLYIGLRPTTS